MLVVCKVIYIQNKLIQMRKTVKKELSNNIILFIIERVAENLIE